MSLYETKLRSVGGRSATEEVGTFSQASHGVLAQHICRWR